MKLVDLIRGRAYLRSQFSADDPRWIGFNRRANHVNFVFYDAESGRELAKIPRVRRFSDNGFSPYYSLSVENLSYQSEILSFDIFKTTYAPRTAYVYQLNCCTKCRVYDFEPAIERERLKHFCDRITVSELPTFLETLHFPVKLQRFILTHC